MRKLRKIYCKDCGELLSKSAYWNKYKRCRSCATKKQLKNPKNNPFYGKKHSLKTRKKISKAHKGMKHSLKTRKKISLAFIGKNHPCWRGGISFEPYDIKFNKAYKESIRMRDNYKCQLCGAPQMEFTEKLSVHHIDYNKKNTIPRNNVSLCRSCNAKVNFKKKLWIKYFKKLIRKKYDKCKNSV